MRVQMPTRAYGSLRCVNNCMNAMWLNVRLLRGTANRLQRLDAPRHWGLAPPHAGSCERHHM
jgi:hypothetical protein